MWTKLYQRLNSSSRLGSVQVSNAVRMPVVMRPRFAEHNCRRAGGRSVPLIAILLGEADGVATLKLATGELECEGTGGRHGRSAGRVGDLLRK